MRKFSGALTAVSLALMWPVGAHAGETMMVFAVDSLKYACASCRYIVEQSMAGVAGVKSVTVSLENATATVVFDDEMTTAAEVANASADVGFPARAFLDEG